MTEVLGWSSSVILLMTLVRQVNKQWQEGRTEGISKWLFVGQLAASVGFTVYSFLTGNWVFVFTNAALMLNNIVGVILYFKFRDKEASDAA
jgi:MtN3 and saliva related transmembrane protein